MSRMIVIGLWLLALVLGGCADAGGDADVEDAEVGETASALIACEQCERSETLCYASGQPADVCEAKADRCFAHCLWSNRGASLTAESSALSTARAGAAECNAACDAASFECMVSATGDADLCYCAQAESECRARCAGRTPPPLSYCE